MSKIAIQEQMTETGFDGNWDEIFDRKSHLILYMNARWEQVTLALDRNEQDFLFIIGVEYYPNFQKCALHNIFSFAYFKYNLFSFILC